MSLQKNYEWLKIEPDYDIFYLLKTYSHVKKQRYININMIESFLFPRYECIY